MPSEIIIDATAGTLTITECAVTFPYSSTPDAMMQTHAGVIVVTPTAGVAASFPIATQGTSGLPPTVDIIGHQLEPGDPLPTPNPAKTVLDPGGPGEASHLQFDWYVNKGEDGVASGVGTYFAANPGGSPEDTDMMVKTTGAATLSWAPTPLGNMYWPGSIAATTYNNTDPRTIATVSVPVQRRKCRMVPFAACTITGSSDTRVDLIARVGDAASDNHEVGRDYGRAGGVTADFKERLYIMPIPAAGSTSTIGVVAAGAGPTPVYLVADQMAASSNSWSTPDAAGGTRFGVIAMPVP